MEKYIYVDNSSTTKLNSKVLDKMLPFMTKYYGNASTAYELGNISRKYIDEAREKIAKYINVKSEEIYFTSSGTEANNLAILGIARANKQKGRHIITSQIEHASVLNSCRQLEKEGFSVTYVKPDKKGIITVDSVIKAIREDTILVSIMYVNNELGTINPIYEIGEYVKARNIIFHTDSVQAAPHIKLDASKYDSITMSAHKFGGPKGIGILYLKNNVKCNNILFGGHQESGLRPGTENVSNIVGAAYAYELCLKNMDENNKYEKKIRNYFYTMLNKYIKNIIVYGDLEKRIPGNINFRIDGVDSNEVIVYLNMNHIYASTGSACNTKSQEISHVIKAIGENDTTIRMTFSSENTVHEVNNIISVIQKCVKINQNKKNVT